MKLSIFLLTISLTMAYDNLYPILHPPKQNDRANCCNN